MLTPDAVIGFDGEFRFLSNFYIEPDGTHVEGEYQQQKCRHDRDMVRFVGLTPGRAKRLGRSVEIRPDWEKVKVLIMRDLVMKKFTDHVFLDQKLSLTGSRYLMEENYWGDTFWGTVHGVGLNHLGHILMSVRDIPF